MSQPKFSNPKSKKSRKKNYLKLGGSRFESRNFGSNVKNNFTRIESWAGKQENKTRSRIPPTTVEDKVIKTGSTLKYFCAPTSIWRFLGAFVYWGFPEVRIFWFRALCVDPRISNCNITSKNIVSFEISIFLVFRNRYGPKNFRASSQCQVIDLSSPNLGFSMFSVQTHWAVFWLSYFFDCCSFLGGTSV